MHIQYTLGSNGVSLMTKDVNTLGSNAANLMIKHLYTLESNETYLIIKYDLNTKVKCCHHYYNVISCQHNDAQFYIQMGLIINIV